MSIQAPPSPSSEQPYIPTETQLTRAASLRRFNWLYVYAPVLLGGLVILALVVWMLVGIFTTEGAETAAFLSGLADLILIFFMMPMLLLCALGPAALGGILYYAYDRRRKQREANVPVLAGGPVQRLFWRLESLLDTVREKLDAIYPRIAGPIIKMNSLLAYLGSWISQIKRHFNKSNNTLAE